MIWLLQKWHCMHHIARNFTPDWNYTVLNLKSRSSKSDTYIQASNWLFFVLCWRNCNQIFYYDADNKVCSITFPQYLIIDLFTNHFYTIFLLSQKDEKVQIHVVQKGVWLSCICKCNKNKGRKGAVSIKRAEMYNIPVVLQNSFWKEHRQYSIYATNILLLIIQ